jgi:endonuclease/exonuclease/phosphatase family metal-dependent hydrolase
MTRVRVATYNIHGGVGTDGRFDLGRIAEVIRALEADVVLLQEVGDPRKRWPAVNQAHDLAELTAMSYAVGYTMPAGPWGYGNVVLARGALGAVERFDLSVARREPRGCLRVDVAACGVSLTVIALHLGLGFLERRAQVRGLCKSGGAIDGVRRPLVVGGDWNEFPPGPAASLARRAFVDAGLARRDRRPTFPSRRPVLRLDRLYSRGGAAVVGYNVIASPLARLASDHLPVIAEYEVNGE